VGDPVGCPTESVKAMATNSPGSLQYKEGQRCQRKNEKLKRKRISPRRFSKGLLKMCAGFVHPMSPASNLPKKEMGDPIHGGYPFPFDETEKRTRPSANATE